MVHTPKGGDFTKKLEYVLMAVVMWRVYNCMSYFLPKGDYVMMYVILCISIHMMLIVLFVFVFQSIFL